jgi:hypothetical protein
MPTWSERHIRLSCRNTSAALDIKKKRNEARNPGPACIESWDRNGANDYRIANALASIPRGICAS